MAQAAGSESVNHNGPKMLREKKLARQFGFERQFTGGWEVTATSSDVPSV
jgi:hypothetical protein